MSTKIELTLKPELLGAIAGIWDGGISAISPLRYSPASQVTPQMQQMLKKGGIFDSSGNIPKDIKNTLEALANPRAFSRIYLSGGPKVFEYVAYFAEDGRTVSITNVAGDLLVNDPAPNDEIIEWIRLNIGDSVYRNSTFEAEMKTDETLVLAAMIDIQRKAFLKAIADEKDSGVINQDIESIYQMLARKEKKSLQLIDIFKELMGAEKFTSANSVKQVLERLSANGSTTRNNGNYALNDELTYLSRRFLVFDNILTLTSGRVGKNGRVGVVGFTCIQAGVHDLLLIDANEGVVQMESISSAAVLGYTSHFLKDGAALKNLDDNMQPEIMPSSKIPQPPRIPQRPSVLGKTAEQELSQKNLEQPGAITCSKCGTPNPAGAKFCAKCGADMASKPKFCPKCGNATATNEKFCRKCGWKLK